MLPYTPLHHLLMRELGFPVVATSGNVSDEPIAYRDADALDRLVGERGHIRGLRSEPLVGEHAARDALAVQEFQQRNGVLARDAGEIFKLPH